MDTFFLLPQLIKPAAEFREAIKQKISVIKEAEGHENWAAVPLYNITYKTIMTWASASIAAYQNFRPEWMSPDVDEAELIAKTEKFYIAQFEQGMAAAAGA